MGGFEKSDGCVVVPNSPTVGLFSDYFCSLGRLEKINPEDVLEWSDAGAEVILVNSPPLGCISDYFGVWGGSDVGDELKSPEVCLISVYLAEFENRDDELVLLNNGLASVYLEKLGKSNDGAALEEAPMFGFISAYLGTLGNNGIWLELEKSPIDGLVSDYLLLLGKSDDEAILVKREGVFELLKRPMVGLVSVYLGGLKL